MRLSTLEQFYQKLVSIDSSYTKNLEIDLNQVLSETLNNFSEPQLFVNTFNDVYRNSELTLIIRLCKWFTYFNSQYLNNPVFSKNSYLALMSFCRENDLLQTQTQLEFEISLTFYDKIIRNPGLTIIDSVIIAKKLLSASIIYSKCYGLQLKPFKLASQMLFSSSQFSEINVSRFLETLFVKYQSPKSLLFRIEYLKLIDVNFLSTYLSGKNPKYTENINISATNKELGLLLFKIPEEIQINEDVVKKLAGVAKVMSNAHNHNNIIFFFNRNNFFKYRIDDFLLEINFWIKAYNLISESIELDSVCGVTEYLDYIEYKKREHGKSYKLNKTTVLSLQNAVHEWHNQTNRQATTDLLNLTWSGTGKESVIIIENYSVYEFSEIKNGKMLFKESNNMKHCVFSYIQKCLSNICSIWSLKEKINSSYINLLTIEIQNKQIIQIKGKGNREPSELELTLVEKFADINNFKFHVSL